MTDSNRVKVRLTLFPDRDHEVLADELPSLRAQGLLIEDEPAETGTPAGKTHRRRNGGDDSGEVGGSSAGDDSNGSGDGQPATE